MFIVSLLKNLLKLVGRSSSMFASAAYTDYKVTDIEGAALGLLCGWATTPSSISYNAMPR